MVLVVQEHGVGVGVAVNVVAVAALVWLCGGGARLFVDSARGRLPPFS